MPDHVHLFARPELGTVTLARWMQAWKSLSSRALAAELGIAPPVWQKDYFDRFMRSADDYTGKWNYVVANPVRAGLVGSADEWPWQGVITDLEF